MTVEFAINTVGMFLGGVLFAFGMVSSGEKK